MMAQPRTSKLSPLEFSTNIYGFNENVLIDHIKLYQGYVENANATMTAMESAGGVEFDALNRRLSWELNGIYLHELYFGGLAGDTQLVDAGNLLNGLKNDFGSSDVWEKQFRGMAMTRGNGWTLLTYDQFGGRLRNVWVDDHHIGLLANSKIIIAFDAFDHAYIRSFKLDRQDYAEAFMHAINWQVADSRYSEINGACRSVPSAQ